MGNSI